MVSGYLIANTSNNKKNELYYHNHLSNFILNFACKSTVLSIHRIKDCLDGTKNSEELNGDNG
jgi:hypothetical protein